MLACVLGHHGVTMQGRVWTYFESCPLCIQVDSLLLFKSAALKPFVHRSAIQLAMLIRVLPHCLSEPASHMASKELARTAPCPIPTQEHMSVSTPNRMRLGGHIARRRAVKKQRGLINQQRNPDVPPTLLTLNRHTIVPPPISEH